MRLECQEGSGMTLIFLLFVIYGTCIYNCSHQNSDNKDNDHTFYKKFNKVGFRLLHIKNSKVLNKDIFEFSQ